MVRLFLVCAGMGRVIWSELELDFFIDFFGSSSPGSLIGWCRASGLKKGYYLFLEKAAIPKINLMFSPPTIIVKYGGVGIAQR